MDLSRKRLDFHLLDAEGFGHVEPADAQKVKGPAAPACKTDRIIAWGRPSIPAATCAEPLCARLRSRPGRHHRYLRGVNPNDPATESCRAVNGRLEKAILAGGCFWGMQDLFRRRPGVVSTRVGYTGGDVPDATYGDHGTHAEAIEVVFDPDSTSYRDLLEFFFQIHDPTTVNRQGNDIGTSYRSAIFYLADEQRRIARQTIADIDASGRWPGKVVTEVVPAGPFWEAEPEHQNFLERYPNGYTCHFVRPDWVLPRRTQPAAT